MHGAVLFRRGKGADPLRDVAPHDLERRLPDAELLLERQVEEGERLLVAFLHRRFVDAVPGHTEEADLPAGLVDLPGNGPADRHITGAKRRQIDDGEGTAAHGGALLTGRV